MTFKCILLCLFVLVEVNLASYVSPKIIKDSEDIILEAGDSYNLTCQGSEPLIWNFPEATEDGKESWTSFQPVSSKVPHNNDYIYRSVLQISNMSYPFVGFYTCLYERKSNDDSDQIYLYVNDPEHLSIEDKYKVHYAVQHQETTIPCRPTNPDVQVELISYGNDQVFRFNPRTGFLLNSVKEKPDDVNIMYVCIFSSKGKTVPKTVLMDVEYISTAVNSKTFFTFSDVTSSCDMENSEFKAYDTTIQCGPLKCATNRIIFFISCATKVSILPKDGACPITISDKTSNGTIVKLNTLSTNYDNFDTIYYFDIKTGFWTNDTLIEGKRMKIPWKCKFRGKNSSQVQQYDLPMNVEGALGRHANISALYNMTIENSYNPKTGFTFTVNDLSFEDTYICTFKSSKDDREYEYIIFLKINPPRTFLATPYIEDVSHNHTDGGQTLNLICSLQETSRNIRFDWKTPRGIFNVTKGKNQDNVNVERSQKITDPNGKDYLKSYLHVYDTTVEDSGIYSCIVSDRQYHESSSELNVMVHDTNDCFVEIREENNQSSIAVDAGENVQWILELNAHPIPELIWFDNKGNVVKNDTIYYTDFAAGKAVFKINNVTLENDGSYKVRGIASRDHDTPSCPKASDFEVMLNVYDKPEVCLDSQEDCKVEKHHLPKIYLFNEIVDIECKARGNPLPKIIWKYKECVGEGCNFIEVKDKANYQTQKYVSTSSLRINTSREGIVRCMAFNSLGSDASTMTYYISDIRDGFDINFSEEAIVTTKDEQTEVIIAINSTLTFTCAVSPMRSDSIEVFHNNELLSGDYIRNYKSDNMSHKTTISLHKAKSSNSGIYSCRIRNLNNQLNEYKNVTIAVKDPELAHIWGTNLNKEVVIDYPNMPYKLYCNNTGIPKAKVEWFKDDLPIFPSKRIILEENDSILKFIKTDVTDEGLYRCKVSNAVGSDFKEAALKFKVKPISVAIYYYITGAIGLLLLAAIIYILIKRNKERALRRELKLLGLENFHNGNPENLNPDLGIDDQAELLPYNKKWEFPIEQLKLGKQLGSGAFGVVMKAEARGIIEGEEKSIVAVKMVKKNADQSYIKALASELKIMVHLGKHINVVNLVGACTKNVAKRELLVIVEYCRFGNLQNYLFKHRASFINQVDQISGKIDYDIGTDILERTYSVGSNNTNYAPYSMQDYRRHDSVNSAATQFTSMGDETVILSNNSIQPEWRLNYRGDYKGQVKPVCTGDLIVWSFQVARGMDYLASRKVLHGDLATRNILLADNNIIKICDFGLAKTMYNDNNYKKKGNSPLPIKWMAIESIRDRVFSTQSDVWSFGIVLWELFSLARTPYPGMEADERLYYKLVEGYRMESPIYAPKEIYKIMLDSWNSKPLARPSFTKLVERIGILLEESVQKHYIDLNDPYLKMNTEKLEESDYLAMLSPPSFDILSTPPPHYMNANEPLSHEDPSGSKSPEPRPEGYLFMGANAIFSPRGSDDGVFDFSTGKRKGLNSEKENQELRPMLHSYNNESDTETGYLTPITPLNSVSNPSYHIPPTVPHENKSTNNKESVRTPDNYITMPQYKNLVNSSFKDGVDKSPVKVEIDKDKENVHYVNSDAEMWNSIDV